MKLNPFHRPRTALLATAALAATSLPLFAGTVSAGKESKPVVEPAPETHVHFLIQAELASAYITPRGMIVTNSGLTIQPLFLMFVDLYKGDGFLNSVKAVGGVWNDINSNPVSKQPPFGSDPKTNWVETDPIGGLSIGFAKNFTLDVTYSAFVMHILDIGTSQHLETKLSFNDSDLLGAFALHPYLLYWQELDGKATDADVPQAVFGPSSKSGSHPQPGSSFYFEVGIAPSYTFKNAGNLTVSAPCRVLMPNERFYGEYYGNTEFFGLFEAGLKASVPLTFMPKGYGNWNAYAGFKYQYYNDKNLYNLNTFNAPGEPTRESWAFYGGLSVFF
jgi:hypothetical protein